MKITNVEFFHLNPRLCERNKGHEVRFSGIDTQTVYRVTLDNGVVGYGDERGHVALSELQIAALVDQSPFNFLAGALNNGLMGALYDAMGKAIEEPAYKLFGQKVRDRVSILSINRAFIFARLIEEIKWIGCHLPEWCVCMVYAVSCV